MSIRDMLEAAAAAAAAAGRPLGDCDFMVNKRDFPQLARDPGRDPCAHLFGDDLPLVREAYTAHLPVFSFYTGSAMADLPMPTCDDWAAATGKWLPPGTNGPLGLGSGPDDGPGDGRLPVAVFRGSATGTGTTPATNIRLRLAAWGKARPDLVDVALTGWNLRDRIVGYDPATRQAVVDFLRPAPDEYPFRERMTLADQCARFKYLLYADGHSAASRYGTLMHTPCAVLRVQSSQDATCGRLWLFDYIKGATITTPGREPLEGPLALADHDHYVIAGDLSNLEATILHLRRAPAAEVRGCISRANARAPTVGTITRHWLRHLRAAHALQCGADEAGEHPWSPFSPFEEKYAATEME
jgi:hypothetical protein